MLDHNTYLRLCSSILGTCLAMTPSWLILIILGTTVCPAGEIKPIIYTGMQVPGRTPGVVFTHPSFGSQGIVFSSKGILLLGYKNNQSIAQEPLDLYYITDGSKIDLVTTQYFTNTNSYHLHPTQETSIFFAENKLTIGTPGNFRTFQEIGDPAPGTPNNAIVNGISNARFERNWVVLREFLTGSQRMRFADPDGTLVKTFASSFPLTDTNNPAIQTDSATFSQMLSNHEYIAVSTSFNTSTFSLWYRNDLSNTIHLLKTRPFGTSESILYPRTIANSKIQSIFRRDDSISTIIGEEYDLNSNTNRDIYSFSTLPDDPAKQLLNYTINPYQAGGENFFAAYQPTNNHISGEYYFYKLDANGSTIKLFDHTFTLPGFEQHTQKYISHRGVTISNDQDVLFRYTYDPANLNLGLLVARLNDGSFHTIAKPGDVVDLPDGTSRTISFINPDILARIDENNRTYFYAAFTDGTDGLLYSDILAIPEPSAIVGVIGLVAVAAFRRWRYSRFC
ncbi:MAG: hypothetical protein SFX18_15210 [Pirellulales bacterium]|nr:hypothetical protein [Pirellulales bacterium]